MVRIHFPNVGHGDCTIIEHASGNLTMIDVNNADQLDDDSRKELAEAYLPTILLEPHAHD